MYSEYDNTVSFEVLRTLFWTCVIFSGRLWLASTLTHTDVHRGVRSELRAVVYRNEHWPRTHPPARTVSAARGQSAWSPGTLRVSPRRSLVRKSEFWIQDAVPPADDVVVWAPRRERRRGTTPLATRVKIGPVVSLDSPSPLSLQPSCRPCGLEGESGLWSRAIKYWHHKYAVNMQMQAKLMSSCSVLSCSFYIIIRK